MSEGKLIDIIKDLDQVQIVCYPYGKYGEYVIAIKPHENSMNLKIADLAKIFGVRYSEFVENLPVMKKFGDELEKRFNNYQKLAKENLELRRENERLKVERNRISTFFSQQDITAFNQWRKKVKGMKPLFIPLNTKYYEAFESGAKTEELRKHGVRWNHDTCPVGRAVVLSKGYGKKHRMQGVISNFKVQHGSLFGSGYKADIEAVFGTLDINIACISIVNIRGL